MNASVNHLPKILALEAEGGHCPPSCLRSHSDVAIAFQWLPLRRTHWEHHRCSSQAIDSGVPEALLDRGVEGIQV